MRAMGRLPLEAPGHLRFSIATPCAGNCPLNVLAGQEKFPETLAAMENFLKLFSEDRFAPQVRQKRDLLKAHIEKPAGAQPTKKP